MTGAETYLFIQPSADGTLCTTLLIEVSDDVSFCTTAIIIFRFFIIFREEFNCWESSDFIFLANVGILAIICVDVGDDTLETRGKKKKSVSNKRWLTSPSGLKVDATFLIESADSHKYYGVTHLFRSEVSRSCNGRTMEPVECSMSSICMKRIVFPRTVKVTMTFFEES